MIIGANEPTPEGSHVYKMVSPGAKWYIVEFVPPGAK
jgi:hypothetical protein